MLGLGPNIGTGGTFAGNVDKLTVEASGNTTIFDFEPGCSTDCYVNAATGDDNNSGLSGDPLKTIGAGVNAVTAGGTVHVAAGTYDESVTINKGLTLVGANTGVSGTATRGPESLVTRTSGQSGPDFNITTAARVTIDGFRAQFNGTDLVGGVLFSTTTANQLVFSHNVVDNSVYNNALLYDTSATSSTIQDNLFTNIQQTGSSGTGVIGAWGVTPSGALDALGISGNTFSHLTDSDGVPALNLNTVSGFVSSNTFDDIHQYGILLADKLGGLSIRSNVFNNIHNDTPGSSDSRGSGVRTFSAPNFVGLVSISHNTFSNSYHGVRVANDGSPADISSGYLRVKRNAMIGNSAAGISVASGTSGTLDGTCNWWGQASGPAAGQVAGSVTSSPFLTSSDLDGSCPGSPPHATVPGPPGKVTSQPRNRGAMVHWSAPTDNGGSPINGYLVTPLINGVAQPVQTFDSTAKSELISGLKNGVAYKFRVARATRSVSARRPRRCPRPRSALPVRRADRRSRTRLPGRCGSSSTRRRVMAPASGATARSACRAAARRSRGGRPRRSPCPD